MKNSEKFEPITIVICGEKKDVFLICNGREDAKFIISQFRPEVKGMIEVTFPEKLEKKTKNKTSKKTVLTKARTGRGTKV